MLSRFFIDRPIFAWVVAIGIMLAGVLAILSLPVAQYPAIALPQVSVAAVYPGASAKTVEDSVTQVIEQRMKGLDGLIYMTSTSDAAGSANVTLTFEAGTDPDIAQVQVQNKLQAATALLPVEVQQQGLTVAKAQQNFFKVIALYDESGRLNAVDLGDYVASNVLDPLSRVEGVGDTQLFGSGYAMRIWLDPSRLAAVQLTPGDVAVAVRAQNAQISAGQIGGSPSLEGTVLNATVSAQSRLQTAEQFRAITLKTAGDGSIVRLGDVARLELGAESYAQTARYNGKPAAGLAVKLATGANALDTAAALDAALEEMAESFPDGVRYAVPYDTTPFVELSIEEVVVTLLEAIVLVFVVMFVFLQNWRATLIPTLAVPVVLLGVFGVLAALGYTINTLTLFGLVLAIGLLVDDAIVVVENVERVMAEEGLSPLEATRKSMDEITGALVGIALVLAAVFVPMAFFGGSQGVIYRQFSVTLVSAMALSVLVALVLTPALCATLLKAPKPGRGPATRGPFGWFNRSFDRLSGGYQKGVRGVLARGGRSMLVYGVVVLAMGLLYVRLPTAFLPDEDQGVLFNLVQLPAGATQARTVDVLEQVERHYLEDEKAAVAGVFTAAGFSFAGAGENAGIGFVQMRPWGERKGADLTVAAVAARAGAAFGGLRDATVFPIVPPAVQELGNASGFDLQLQDQGGLGHEALIAARNQLLGMAAGEPTLAGVRPNGQDDVPQLAIDVDQARAGAMGLSIAEVNSALSAAFGGTYINDFTDRGRVKRVYMQGEASARNRPEDLEKWYVRNAAGGMVPFSAIATARWTYGSPRLERFEGVPSVNIQGQAAPGQSSGAAMETMETLVGRLPAGIGYAWTGLSYQEREAGSQSLALYALSLAVVFLLLAALYESWTIPLSVLLVIPLGVFGALAAASLRGFNNDIYFQVALLTTMGLAAKNAILIVEFAKDLQAQGRELVEATLEAVRIRLRPILMTSLAFVFGVTPLAISTGAGSGSQNAIGTGVIGGVVTATVLGLFFIPLFYVLVQRLFAFRRRRKPNSAPRPALPPVAEGAAS